ncbi:MAG: tetratricopeptide repeat protein [Rheinheimera sp.]|nr:tetratricopeptide repeat protein [Rheinheimera sp.]
MNDQTSVIHEAPPNNGIVTAQSLHAGFSIGPVTVLPHDGFVVVRGEHRHVTPKALEVLIQLALHAENAVSQPRLLQAVWGDKKASKANLSHAVSELRHVLGDHKECPEFIQTLPRRGYRLLMPVHLLNPASLPTAHSPLVERRGQGAAGAGKHWSWLISLFRGSRLFSVSVAFLVSVWLFIQVMAITFPLLNISTTGMKLTLLILLIGFPIVLLVTWVGDLRERKRRMALSDNPHKQKFWRRQLYIDLGFLLLSFSAVFFLARSVKIAIDADAAAQVAGPVQTEQTAPIANSVAVLPFMLSTGSNMADYLLEGIRQELLYSLTQLNQFPVLADRAMQTVSADADYQQLADKLRVEYVVEGRISTTGEQLQLDVSVVETATGMRRWSERLIRQQQALPALQQELHRKVQNAFALILPSTQHSNTAVDYQITSSFQAFDAYMQAQQKLKKYDDMASLDRAEQLLLQALRADPDFAVASASLCKLHLDKYILSRSVEEFELAKRACQHAAGLNVNQAQVYAALGDLYRVSGQYSLAMAQYQQALKVNERWVDALTGKAMVHSATNEKAQAEKLFNLAIEIEPGYWQNYMHYGRFLYGNGNFAAAARRYERASQLKPDSTDVLNSQGAAWFFSGEFEQAIAAWQQVVELAPVSLSFSNLGTAHYFNGDYANAEQLYRQALAVSADDYTIWTNLADVLDVQAPRRDEALPLYQKALQLAQQNLVVDAQSQPLLAQISRLQAELQLCDAALKTEQQLQANKLTDFYMFYDLAIASFNCQRNNSGEAYIRKAVEYGYPAELVAADPKIPHVTL